ncbi:MAG: hypothetical protein IT364_19260 [Candidatus Hydrogenedentes bacterium]|nr:hypothetical protein [Candidatus Hydrogenedentota bacterium]
MPAESIIEVLPFNADSFFASLTNKYCTVESVKRNDRARYLEKYLTKIGAKTIVVEREYVDGDYVDDFASYYVKCFEPYSIRCKRLHFFSLEYSEVSATPIAELACGGGSHEDTERLQNAYMGFLVVRPLPVAIIGRTVFQTYDDDGGRRQFTSLLEYESHILSIPFWLRSLAFQEQDTVIAACATVALWSALHKAADLFGTQTPRPSAITKSANQVVSDTRSIPSKGLIVEQMCSAIAQQGLEPEMIRVVEDLPLRSLLYGYLRVGLAPIVIVQIERLEGLHAVTFAGYSIRDDVVPVFPAGTLTDAIPMIGRRIDAFYGHDDQVGPFAKHIVEQSRHRNHATPHPTAFAGTWRHPEDEEELQLYPVQVIVPVYNKIRVSVTDVQLWLIRLDSLFRQIVPPDIQYEWDVYLTTTTDYKREIRQQQFGSESYRRSVILTQHPRFLWRALLRVRGSDVPDDKAAIFEMLFDATDIPNSFTGFCLAWHFDAFRVAVNAVCALPENYAELCETLTEKLVDCLRKASAKEVFFYPRDMKGDTG